MVSSAPFYSGKSFHLSRSVPFWVMILVLVAMFFVTSEPGIALFSLFCCYAVSGYLYWGWRTWRGEANPARPVRGGPAHE
jgi:CDP-diacylglycerol--serine O-phosphatidyltransferase